MKYILAGTFVIISYLLSAQCNLRVSGQITDLHSGEPVPFAKVYAREANRGVISDSTGRYEIDSMCTGVYTFIFSHHIGCDPVKQTLFLERDTVFNARLEFHFQEFGEVRIEQFRIDRDPVSTIRLTPLEKLSVTGRNLGDQLKLIPGVSVLNTGATISKPVIHGLHSNRVLLINNGVRQEGQQWGNEHAPEVDPFLMTDMAVVKGSNSVRYGSDAIAGVILLEPAKIDTSKALSGSLLSSFYSNGRQGAISGMLSGTIRKFRGFYWRAQGTYKKGGNLKTPDYYLKNTGLEEYNFSWNTGYASEKFSLDLFYSQFNTDIGIFSASHIGNLTDLQNAYAANEPLEQSGFTYKVSDPRQHIEHELFRVKSQLNLGARHKLILTYGRQYNLRNEFDKDPKYNDSLEALNLPDFQLTLVTHTLNFDWEYQVNEHWKSVSGVSALYQGNTYSGRYFIPNFRKYNGGIYNVQTVLLHSWKLELGTRYDLSHLQIYKYEDQVLITPTHDFGNWSVSGGISKEFSHHLVARFNVSTAWRPPSINELYSDGLHHGSGTIEVGDRQLKKEQSLNYQAGLEYKSTRMNFYLDMYHMDFGNFIYLEPTLVNELTIKGAFPVFHYRQVSARFSGVDLNGNFKISEHLQYRVKYAMVRAYNRTNRGFLVGIPADRLENGVQYDHSGKKVNMHAGVNTLYMFKQGRVEPNSDFVPPPSDYFLISLDFGIEFRQFRNPLELSFAIDNLFNKSYRDYMDRFRYYADEPGRNISIKVRYNFNIQKK